MDEVSRARGHKCAAGLSNERTNVHISDQLAHSTVVLRICSTDGCVHACFFHVARAECRAALSRLPASASDELADVLIGRYERGSTIITSNRVIEDWLKMLGDVVSSPRCSTA